MAKEWHEVLVDGKRRKWFGTKENLLANEASVMREIRNHIPYEEDEQISEGMTWGWPSNLKATNASLTNGHPPEYQFKFPPEVMQEFRRLQAEDGHQNAKEFLQNYVASLSYEDKHGKKG